MKLDISHSLRLRYHAVKTKSTPREAGFVSATSRKERIAATFRLQVARDERQRREMGARIRELRESRGLKQQYVADYIGKTLRTYQMYQAGDIDPGQEALEKMAELFEVTPQFIMRGDTPEPFGPTVADIDRRLQHIEAQLDELLTQRRTAEQLDGHTAEDALDYLNRATAVMTQVLGQLGRDVGRKDLEQAPSADRARRNRPAAA
jgi:transcriptional regulator with XRE-family HTH domain